jgi:transcriptional regulator with XRE-family HTH domain
MNAIQLKMARVALGLNVRQTAELSRASHHTINRIEAGGNLKARTLEKVRRALEAAGVEFIDGTQPGVRLKKQQDSVANLTLQIDDLREQIARGEPSGRASPERGMQQLEDAKDKNDLMKLKNRRTKQARRDKK